MFEITRRDPIDRQFRELASFISRDPFFNATWDEEGTLAIDVSEENGDIVVHASLPGFRKEDIDVQVHNGVLTIKAEHTEETASKDKRYYRKERRVGSMSRRIALPGAVADTARAEAELKDGVLTLRIPQTEAAKPKQIAIK